jgi:hypothetical protein
MQRRLSQLQTVYARSDMISGRLAVLDYHGYTLQDSRILVGHDEKVPLRQSSFKRYTTDGAN